jgi:hypothetical protein
MRTYLGPFGLAASVFCVSVRASVAFISSPTLITPNYPLSVVVADFNGDSKLDIAVTNQGADSVSVYLGNGDGTFGARTDFAVGASPTGIVAADFNHDGFMDIAVANANGNSASILFGKANGAFLPAFNFATGNNPAGLATADINGDGYTDLITANLSGGFSVLNGTGSFGPFAFGTAQTIYTAVMANNLLLSDVSGGGHPDLVAGDVATNDIKVFINNGSGTFATPLAYSSGRQPKDVTVVDLNRDGLPEIISANFGDDDISVFSNSGSGSFSAGMTYLAGSGAISVAAADFEHNHKPTIATVLYFLGQLSFRASDSDGALSTQLQGGPKFQTGQHPVSIAIADLNGDGDLDIVVANQLDNSISIFLNDVLFSEDFE